MKQVLEVHYFVRDGMRNEFYDRIISEGIASASMAEEGNEKYDYYFSCDDVNELLLLEVWRDEEAVEAHSRTEHFAKLADIKKELVLDTKISRYTKTV